MTTIWKYPLSTGCSLIVPRDAQLLSVACDPNNQLCAWFLVDDTKVGTTEIERKYAVYGTGNTVVTELPFFATVVQGIYVWHVFIK